MRLRTVRLAAGSTFQDLGRPGWRKFGVPPGGAFDRESYELSLALLGLKEGAVLEIPLMGGEFECEEAGSLAVVGADCRISIDGQETPGQESLGLRPGQRLVIEPATRGVRTYLAGGWECPRILGSASNISIPPSLRSLGPGRYGQRLERPPTSLENRPIRFTSGPQTRPSDLESLAACPFEVGLNSNRVGIRISGSAFAPHRELASEPSVPGAIQLSPSGELLVHGPDGPTIGGYPKIGVVIDADLDRLGQLGPGAKIEFEHVELDVARELARERRDRIDRAVRMIRALAFE